MRRVLSLFSYDWDQSAQSRLAAQYQFEHAGFDIFSFPSSAQLLWFDVERWIERLERKYRGAVAAGKLQAVVSHNEQFGALAAAMLGERLGLAHSPPKAIVQIQHKLLLRQIIERVAPQANVKFAPLECEYGDLPPQGLDYPLFIKPMKAAFSVLARRIESYEELVAHTRFGFFEQWIIRRLTRPFNDAARRLVDMPVDADHMIIEEPIRAAQFNLDGYMLHGQMRVLGVIDEVMYPGTQAFLRFAYPSKLPVDIQTRAAGIVQDVLAAAGFTHGFFNLEFFYDEATDRLSIIEINPRLASQLADLYYWVDGLDVHAMALALFCGDDPADLPRAPSRAGAAASFVFRSFGEAVPPRADADAVQWMQSTFADARVLQFQKAHNNIERDMKWLGSFRYAVMDMHGPNESALHAQLAQVCARFGWPYVI